jgi:hypothetical protein
MGLIDYIKNRKNKQLTLEEKQELTRTQLRQMIGGLFDRMKRVYKDGQRLVYKNPYGLTNEEVVMGLGDDREELIRLAVLLKDVLNIAVPGTVKDGDEYGSVVDIVD